MNVRAATIVLVLVLVDATAGPAQVKNYKAPGSLESTRDLECVASARLDSKYTPADLYAAMGRCVQQNRYDPAVFLYALAGVYGRYDTLRVADKTAHQAIAVLQMQTAAVFSPTKEAAFKKALQATLGSPDGLATTCKEIVRIGPPGYHPRYMIQHGMGAFRADGPAADLVEGFDAPAAWKRSLDTYLHCPGL